MSASADTVNFAALLETVTTEPGRISDAYSAFYGYSLGNQLLALGQCWSRGLAVGPIATFNKWKELGRSVTKGSKAIALCMPVTGKRVDATTGDEVTYARFVFRNNWFVLAQTEGADYQPAPLPGWDKARALAALDVTEIPFDLMDGNVQGYARARSVAINPVGESPFKTLFHELAHILLGHTSEGDLTDDARTPRSLRELEAEATAMLVCAALNLSGLDESRGYVQSWYGAGQPVPESSARKIMKTADAILKAGRETTREVD